MSLTEIDGYRVVRQLGAGGMGQVFLVQHPRLPRTDALKLLDASVSRNDDFKLRFQREADLLAMLSHPNIVTLHDRGEFEDRLWITMEFVDGTDAAALVREKGPLHPDLALQLLDGAGAALDFAWRKQRITHRDAKPANILVGFDQSASGPVVESIKLADFGIAKAAGETTSLTGAGITVGTLQYVSPEAIEGRDLDNRTDIYSLGCTAYHLLAGRPPFTAKSITALIHAHLSQQAPPISEIVPYLPASLDGVFAKVLAKRPEDRFASCADFVAAMREALHRTVPLPIARPVAPPATTAPATRAPADAAPATTAPPPTTPVPAPPIPTPRPPVPTATPAPPPAAPVATPTPPSAPLLPPAQVSATPIPASSLVVPDPPTALVTTGDVARPPARSRKVPVLAAGTVVVVVAGAVTAALLLAGNEPSPAEQPTPVASTTVEVAPVSVAPPASVPPSVPPPAPPTTVPPSPLPTLPPEPTTYVPPPPPVTTYEPPVTTQTYVPPPVTTFEPPVVTTRRPAPDITTPVPYPTTRRPGRDITTPTRPG